MPGVQSENRNNGESLRWINYIRDNKDIYLLSITSTVYDISRHYEASKSKEIQYSQGIKESDLEKKLERL